MQLNLAALNLPALNLKAKLIVLMVGLLGLIYISVAVFITHLEAGPVGLRPSASSS